MNCLDCLSTVADDDHGSDTDDDESVGDNDGKNDGK